MNASVQDIYGFLDKYVTSHEGLRSENCAYELMECVSGYAGTVYRYIALP
jgi:hypothetical protein